MRILSAKIASLGLASVLLLGACGSSSEQGKGDELPTLNDSAETETESETTRTTSDIKEPVDPEQAFAQYEACMSDHGVDVSALTPGGGGATVNNDGAGDKDSSIPAPNAADFEEANTACESILKDAFGEFEMSPEDEAKLADELLDMQKCLADKGFDIDLAGGSFEVDESVDFDEFQQAMNSCAPEGTFGAGQ